ncbi:hypothetical protein EW145_g897 [Phellinidium pouzarii]|uniref:F-box domain-containing protein n=1 Tax=Phellinidium pouzarii TaxID=167371 RepID=A0A4S4LM13_9AGAM|nr:hypothetical protein EW145_g897 [Phellinidium pouzarii]
MATTTATLTTTTRKSTHTTYPESDKVLLRARPYARYAGSFVLVPLLPKPTPLAPLPAEVWRKVITMVIESDSDSYRKYSLDTADQVKASQKGVWSKWNLALVCKELKNTALPILYAHCDISTIQSLKTFTAHLSSSEQKWDSIRRIPYSTPGRWVQTLNLSELEVASQSESYAVDALLTTLFPLLPFLVRLELSLSLQLSRRAMLALGLRDGAQNLRSLTGVKYDVSVVLSGEDPLTELVSCCSRLEELEVVGLGMDEVDALILANAIAGDTPTPRYTYALRPMTAPLCLPFLHSLTLLAMPTSPLLFRLIHSELPALHSVVITPYGESPAPHCLVAEFLSVHGQSIRSLVLHTPKSWPTVRFSPPAALLRLLPNLLALSLESTRLVLDAPLKEGFRTGYPLSSIWVSRPTPGVRDELLRLLPDLPNLREVRVRDVRWAKSGISPRAREAGFQGEMYTWRRLLAPRGVRVLDANGCDGAGL